MNDINFIKVKCTNKEYEVCHFKDSLCCFGCDDLWIENNCNINFDSYSTLGSSYELLSDGDAHALAGTFYFKVLEIEVYKLISE